MNTPSGHAAAALDPARLYRTLSDHQVDYVLVGGGGANAHGATRQTDDLDIVARWTTDNLDRIGAALDDLGAGLRVEGMTEPLPAPHDARLLSQMQISSWTGAAGDFDILSRIPHGTDQFVGYDELASRAAQIQLYGVAVQVASLDDIIVSKETANRPKDRHALDELRRLRDAPQTKPT